MKLEALRPNATVRGILPDAAVTCVRRPFRREPDFGVTSVNYKLSEILARAEAPR